MEEAKRVNNNHCAIDLFTFLLNHMRPIFYWVVLYLLSSSTLPPSVQTGSRLAGGSNENPLHRFHHVSDSSHGDALYSALNHKKPRSPLLLWSFSEKQVGCAVLMSGATAI